MSFTDDIPKHKKKSQKKTPRKSDHKHLCEPCIIERPEDWYKKEHERSGKTVAEFYGYCPICGKITAFIPNRDRWYTTVKRNNGVFSYLETVPTEEGARELNPTTRTLPTFEADGICVKRVEHAAITDAILRRTDA